jgi:hypothetical protein
MTVMENSARIALDPTSITLGLPVLEYLLLNLTALANQLVRFKMAETEVSAYAQSAVLRSSSRIGVSLQYFVLFERTDTCDRVCERERERERTLFAYIIFIETNFL